MIQNDELVYDQPIHVQLRRTELYVDSGDRVEDEIIKKNFFDISDLNDYFPKIAAQKDNLDGLEQRFLARLTSDSIALTLSNYQGISSIREDTHTILNGDFVRLRHVDKWLSHYPNQESDADVFFEKIDDPTRQYSYINTIFQIFKKDSKEANPVSIGQTDQYFLKHFTTSKYIHFSSPASLFADSEINQTDIETPYFNFETKNEDSVLVEKLPTKIKYQNNQDYEACLKPCEPHPVNNVQFEMNTLYYFGFKIPEDYCYKNQKNLIRHLAGISSEFEVEGFNIVLEKVTPEEMGQVLKFQAFAKKLINFSTESLLVTENPAEEIPKINEKIKDLIKSCKEINGLLIRKEEDTKEARLNVTTPKYKLFVPNHQTQSLMREFQIFDLLYFVIFSYIEKKPRILSLDEADISLFDTPQLLELYESFANLYINGLHQNSTSRFYNSQFVRIIIHSMLGSISSVFTHPSNTQHLNRMRQISLSILKVLLWDDDLDALGQINYYIEPLNDAALQSANFQTHYLELLEHVSSSKATNFVNSYRDRFIKKFLTSEELCKKILPTLELQDADGNILISFQKRDDQNKFSLPELQSNKEAYEYFIACLRLIIALSSSKSVEFYHAIIKLYPLKVLKSILQHQIHPEIKLLVQLIILHAHFDYVKVPISLEAVHFKNDKLKNLSHKQEVAISAAYQGSISDYEYELLLSQQLRAEVENIAYVIQFEKTSESVDLLKLAATYPINAQTVQIILLYIQGNIQKNNYCIDFLNEAQSLLIKLIKKYYEGGAVDIVRLPEILETFGILNKKLMAHSAASIYDQTGAETQTNLSENVLQSINKSKTNYLESFAPFDLLALNEPIISGAALSYLNDVSLYESQLVDELDKFVTLSSFEEVETLQEIINIVIPLHRYTRNWNICKEKLDAITIEASQYMIVIGLVEKLFSILYKPEIHLNPDNQHAKLSEAEIEASLGTFFFNFRKEKAPERDLPFKIVPQAVCQLSQRLFCLLSVHNTLIRLLGTSMNLTVNNFAVDHPNKLYLSKLLIVMLTVFVYYNKYNQNLLVSNQAMIRRYYEQPFLNISADTMTLFAELMRDNEELLAMKKKFIYDITCSSFIGTIKPRIIKTGGTYLGAVFMSMHYLYKAHLPLTIYDSFATIEEKLKEVINTTYNEIGIMNRLKPAAELEIGPNILEHNYVSLNILEFLAGTRDILQQANAEGKETRLEKLRNNFNCHQFVEGLTKAEYRFHFGIKSLILECISQMHLSKNFVNANFLTIEDIPSTTKLVAYLINEVLEFLQFSQDEHHKHDSITLYKTFIETLEKIQGETIDEGDVKVIINETHDRYNAFREFDLQNNKQRSFLVDIPLATLWSEYIYNHCWTTLTKLSLHYPTVFQVTGLLDIFLTVSKKMAERTHNDTTYYDSLNSIHLDEIQITEVQEYESHKANLSDLSGLLSSRLSELKQLKDDSDKSKISPESSQKNKNLAILVQDFKEKSLHNLDENLELFARHIESSKQRKNILSQLLTTLHYNPLNLPKKVTAFVAALLNKYLTRKTDPSEFSKLQTELSDLDAERRLVEAIYIVQDHTNMQELFRLLLTYASGDNQKVNKALEQRIQEAKYKLLWNNREIIQYEAHVIYILEDLLKAAKGNDEATNFLDFCIQSHNTYINPDNDQFRELRLSPVSEQIQIIRRELQAVTQLEVNTNQILTKIGPIPLSSETIVEIFRIHELDSEVIKKLKTHLSNLLKKSQIESSLISHLKKRIIMNHEDLEMAKLDGIVILDLYISNIKNVSS